MNLYLDNGPMILLAVVVIALFAAALGALK